jgi:phosphotransferase system enzyme I (PtsI)
MKIIKGIAGAPGVSIARVFHIEKHEIVVTKEGIGNEKELSIFRVHSKKVNKELSALVKQVEKKIGKEESEVFEAHKLILNDPQIVKEVEEDIFSTTDSAAFSVQKIFTKYRLMFDGMDDEYMKQRAVDINDVYIRLVKSILNITDKSAYNTYQNIIVVADELTPSDTVALDTTKVRGMAVEKGGPTSHATIISRTLGIPAVVGLTGFSHKVNDGDVIILDGNKGEVIIRPTENELTEYKNLIKLQSQEEEELKKYINIDVKTTDGKSICIEANVGGTEDAKLGLKNGMHGIGLFRTEFSFMHGSK